MVYRPRTLKVVVVGDSNAGKTCLLNRYVRRQFTDQYKATIGADFSAREAVVRHPDTQRDLPCKLQIWDTAGQERFKSLQRAFYRGASCCVLVYDLTRPEALAEVAQWKAEFLEQTGYGDTDVTFVVFGNKSDLLSEDELVARKQAGVAFLEEHKLSIAAFQVTSAKTGAGVEEAFQVAADHTLLRELAVEAEAGDGHGGHGRGGGDGLPVVSLRNAEDLEGADACAC